ncbi:MAG TPA: hypothetical protein VMM15_01695 [Bradyrhizobium sp.]|nr:hypothetical protein [Bradyrhizobium sp.]
MTKWIIAAAALALAANAAAFAQSGRNKGSMSDSMSNRPMTEAPVGHRQPRTSDVPDEKNLSSPSDPMNKEDAALDRKIKSICRGC